MRLFRITPWLLLLFAPLAAQEVEVASVRFTNVRAPGGANGTWLEADIALNVHPPAGAPGQMISRVKVTLLCAFELPALAGDPVRQAQGPEPVAGRRLEHYRASAECVALDAGRADVRFYLPPEIVKRDQLHGDPKHWGVELLVGGRPIPPARASYSATLPAADTRKNFQTKGSAAAAANDGMLQPQFLTPFASEYPRATPSFVRHEGP